MALLAHLYSHIRGSQEDIATLSLQYIVSQPAITPLFTKYLLSALKNYEAINLHYLCQSVGRQKERPDMAGVDQNGNEKILCEAKFYAGLTENQPLTYLKRLKEEDGLGLVFICPAARRTSLWTQLMELCKDHTVTDEEAFFACIDEIPMTIVTWDILLDMLRRAASGLPEIVSDINQLDEFCRKMDDEAFIPFSPEDFGPNVARREERYYSTMDQLYNHLIANKSIRASGKNLRATPNRVGYTRYIKVNQYSLSLAYDRNLWLRKDSAETPFWIAITAGNWYQPVEFHKAFSRYPDYERQTEYNAVYLALHAKTNATLDEVAKDLMNQVLGYIKVLDEYTLPQN